MDGPTSPWRRLLAGALLAWALFACGARANGLYCEPRDEPPRKPLKWVALERPFYFFDRAGRLYRGNFGNDSRRQISDHGFRSAPDFTHIRASRSPDGRWIAYSGRLEASDAMQYWL